MAQVYLRQIEPEFSVPETSVESSPQSYDWRDWVNEYIDESKAMLTVRRKNVLLKELQQLGVTEVIRRNDVTVDLTNYELDMQYSKAHELYARRHEKHWTDFVEDAVERTGHPELKQIDGIYKQELADELR